MSKESSTTIAKELAVAAISSGAVKLDSLANTPKGSSDLQERGKRIAELYRVILSSLEQHQD